MNKRQTQEYLISAGQKFQPDPQNAAELALKARLVDNDGELSESLLRLDPRHQLQALKSQLYSGDLSAAQNTLSHLQHLPNLAEVDQIELELESARWDFLSGYFESALVHCQKILDSDHADNLTRFTTLQVQAAALEELGQFVEALKTAKSVVKLTELFQGGNVRFYAENQIVKLTARLGHEPQARQLLEGLWQRCINEGQSLAWDHLTTLCRTELFLGTWTSQDSSHWGALAHLACEKVGDQLYCALIRAEYLHHLLSVRKNPETEGAVDVSLIRRCRQDRDQFSRLKRFWETTTWDLASILETAHPECALGLPSTEQIQFVLIERRGLWLDLKTKSVVRVDCENVLRRTLIALLNGASDPDEIFGAVYDLKFSKERNSSGLRALLSRTRKLFGLNFDLNEASSLSALRNSTWRFK